MWVTVCIARKRAAVRNPRGSVGNVRVKRSTTAVRENANMPRCSARRQQETQRRALQCATMKKRWVPP